MSNFTVFDIPSFADERGILSVIEDGVLPFSAVRIYWITGASDQTRGGHRHRKTRQALISIQGEVSIFLDNGEYEKTITLSTPNQYLLVEPEDWHTMTFGPNSILLVIASHTYSIDDYVDAKYD